jgi:hypothetical protein
MRSLRSGGDLADRKGTDILVILNYNFPVIWATSVTSPRTDTRRSARPLIHKLVDFWATPLSLTRKHYT